MVQPYLTVERKKDEKSRILPRTASYLEATVILELEYSVKRISEISWAH